jgi:DNA-directed RNA polymerase sigma subunit (sigma70/sigma32)
MKCFELCENKNKSCDKESCRYWINHEESRNCTVIGASKGVMTLQEIGDIFGVTRMRICQIEKKILSKITCNFSRDEHHLS